MTDIFEMELEDEEEVVVAKEVKQEYPFLGNKTSRVETSHMTSISHTLKEDLDSERDKKSPRILDKTSPGGTISTKQNTITGSKEMGKREVTEIFGFALEKKYDPMSKNNRLEEDDGNTTTFNNKHSNNINNTGNTGKGFDDSDEEDDHHSTSSFKQSFDHSNSKTTSKNQQDFFTPHKEDRDKTYMRSKMMYFNRLNVGRSEIKEVTKPRTSPESLTCKSAPQSTPIPILYDNSTSSVFDPQVVVNTMSTTFVPPHEMINRSEFSVWEKDRKKIPKKYLFN